MKKVMYAVRIEGGEYDDYYTNWLFLVDNEEIAISYVNKANGICQKYLK